MFSVHLLLKNTQHEGRNESTILRWADFYVWESFLPELVEEYQASNNQLAIDRMVNKAVNFLVSIESPKKQQQFKRAISNHRCSDLLLPLIQEEEEKALEKQAKQKYLEKCEAYVKTINTHISRKDIQALSSLKPPTIIEHKPPLNPKRTLLEKSPEKVKSYYQKLDNALGGGFPPGGFSLIVARTGVGKTTFLLNLLHQQLVNNPDAKEETNHR